MANVSVYNIEGKEVGTIELNDAVFGVEVNEHLLHMAVVNQLANKRHRSRRKVSPAIRRRQYRSISSVSTHGKLSHVAVLIVITHTTKVKMCIRDSNYTQPCRSRYPHNFHHKVYTYR